MIRKILQKILAVYSFFLILGLLLYGAKSVFLNMANLPLVLLLIFPFLYFFLEFRKKNPPLVRIFSVFSVVLLFLVFLAGAEKITDLKFVLLFLPIVVYFCFFSRQTSVKDLKKVKIVKAEEPEEGRVEDVSLRAFLKTLEGVGLGVVLASLLNPKDASAAFFGSVPGPGTVALKDTGGTKINPAKEDGNLADIKANTKLSGTNDIDEASETITYIGKEDANGGWQIMKIDTTSGTAITYATAANNPGYASYATAWEARTMLTYSSYKDAF